MKIERREVRLQEYDFDGFYTSNISFYNPKFDFTVDDYIDFLRSFEPDEIVVELASALDHGMPGLLSREEVEYRKEKDLYFLQYSQRFGLDLFERNQLF